MGRQTPKQTPVHRAAIIGVNVYLSHAHESMIIALLFTKALDVDVLDHGVDSRKFGLPSV